MSSDMCVQPAKMRTLMGWGPCKLPWKHGEARWNPFSQPIGMGFGTTTRWLGRNIYVVLCPCRPCAFPNECNNRFGIGSILRLVINTWVIGKLDHSSITKEDHTIQNGVYCTLKTCPGSLPAWSGRKRARNVRELTQDITGWWFYKDIATKSMLILDVGSSSRHQKKRFLSVVPKLRWFSWFGKSTSHRKIPLEFLRLPSLCLRYPVVTTNSYPGPLCS